MKRILNKINKRIHMCCICIFALSFTACAGAEDKVVASLVKYENREFFTSGGFQDFTDYAKYHYIYINVEENKYLKKVQETDMEVIDEHLDDFERWIEAIKESDASNEVVVNYDFDREIIDTEDYFYIDSEEIIWSDGDTSLARYNIYLFDTQTQILYYFHNNI